ncbi:MAG: hypothetical protein M0Q42_11275 [Xanthomonadales bacterium]|nr:hypothetical protein [Xanthomonadales bacterium]
MIVKAAVMYMLVSVAGSQHSAGLPRIQTVTPGEDFINYLPSVNKCAKEFSGRLEDDINHLRECLLPAVRPCQEFPKLLKIVGELSVLPLSRTTLAGAAVEIAYDELSSCWSAIRGDQSNINYSISIVDLIARSISEGVVDSYGFEFQSRMVCNPKSMSLIIVQWALFGEFMQEVRFPDLISYHARSEVCPSLSW